MARLAVVGAGAWGRALADVARAGGHEVRLWSRAAPDESAFEGAMAAILAVPTQALRQVLLQLPIPAQADLIITAKGIEQATGRFVHEVAAEACPGREIYLLSGPSFAEDVSRHLPTAVALAGRDRERTSTWARILSVRTFRIYPGVDMIGVALGGALKNVLAIAAGISDGLMLGPSAKAALVSRGLSELMRLGKCLGAKPETLVGLSGLGDLVLTCNSPQSRNFSFGVRLGQGQSVEQALAESAGVVEGASTARAAAALSDKLGLDLPITKAVDQIVNQRMPPADAIKLLLSRPVTAEFE